MMERVPELTIYSNQMVTSPIAVSVSDTHPVTDGNTDRSPQAIIALSSESLAEQKEE